MWPPAPSSRVMCAALSNTGGCGHPPLRYSSAGCPNAGAGTPGRPLLPLWGNSPSALIGPRQLSSTLTVGAALVVARGRGQAPPLHTGAGCAPPSGPPHEPSEAVRVGKRSRSGRSELCRLRRSEGSGACGDAVTVRLFATPGFPPPRAGLRAARAALRSPSLRSIRAAHNGSPLLFYPISGQKERGVIPLVLFGLFTSPRR